MSCYGFLSNTTCSQHDITLKLRNLYVVYISDTSLDNSLYNVTSINGSSYTTGREYGRE